MQITNNGVTLRAARIERHKVIVSLVEGDSQLKVDIFGAPAPRVNAEGRSNEAMILKGCIKRAFAERTNTIHNLQRKVSK
jgi:hypothetical protein